MANRYRESLLDKERFTIEWEVVPGRGAFEKVQLDFIAKCEKAAAYGRIDALAVTDNPGGNPAISPEVMGAEVKKLGLEPITYFTCKDKNRNELESLLYGMARSEVSNLLVMSGDYPVAGYQGRSRPVFDLDPVHVLQLVSAMNEGLEFPGMKGTVKLKPTDFFPGAVVSPFKILESEQMVQYYKLKKKIAAGARFIITQTGYDARKFHELMQFRDQEGLDVPFIGNIYILPFGAAKAMSNNLVPGCVVTRRLVEVLDGERKAEDKGKKARLLRGAGMFAFMKGMGYDGVHISGLGVSFDDVVEVIERGEELVPEWQDIVAEFDYPQDNGFYYFRKQEGNILNRRERAPRTVRAALPFSYRLTRLVHNLCFEPAGLMFGLTQKLVAKWGESGFFRKFEHLVKVAMYDCMDCGDCALPDVAYLCPMSQCPKNQRNGACGGSYNGWCEVYPKEKRCVWVQAYERLKNYHEEGRIENNLVPPPNWDFFHTSSWVNYFSGRDHSAKKIGIKPPAGKG
ncbi:MAG: methylenetetrahydrofolate reductase C-terminal domain-containing protein [Deltaproteobacteria bacterium]|nr:methylenetetrahydrofolate reductase C-terminal domain-containing protein [Candidatus Anaeroferrophillacea bacterium]